MAFSGYRSVGEAAAVGLERGVKISRMLREDEERRKEKEEELGLRRRQIESLEEERRSRQERQQRLDKLAEDQRALAALEADIAATRDAFGGLWQSGARGPQLAELGRRLEELGQARSAALRRIYAPIVQEETASSRALLRDLERGAKSPEDVEPSQLYKAMAVALGRHPSELFARDDGSRSRLGEAADQFVEAMQSGDEQAMLASANVVFTPFLQVGVGEIGRGGAEIVKKEIVAVRADPRGNGRAMPTLLVTAKLPTGETVQYHAPITEGRSTRGDDDKVVSLDVGDVLDYVARLQAAERVVNSPEARKYLASGERVAEPDVVRYLQAYYAAGGKDVMPKQVKPESTRAERIDLGDRVLRIVTEPGGKETREEFKKGIAPRPAGARPAAKPESPEKKRFDLIKEYAKQMGISEEEAAQRLRNLSVLGIRSPQEAEETEKGKRGARLVEMTLGAALKASPGKPPAQVMVESEILARAFRDPSLAALPSGWKFGKFVPGKGFPVLDAKGESMLGPTGKPLWYQ